MHMLASEYKTLPASGGLFDQDDYIVYGLTAVLHAIAERQKREEKKSKDRKGK